MGLFATSVDDPQYASNMGLFRGLANGDVVGGIMGAQDDALNRKIKQVDLSSKQLAEKRAQATFEMMMQAYRDEMGGGAPGASAAPSQPAIPPQTGGLLGSGTYGMPTGGQDASVPPQGPQQGPGGDISSQLSKLSTQALLGLPGVKERFDILKYRNDPQQVAAGGYSRNNVTGAQTYNPDPTKGVTMGPGGSVAMMPNADAVLGRLAGATASAQEGAKDQFALPTTINLPGGPRLMLPSQARALAGGSAPGPAPMPELPGPAASSGGMLPSRVTPQQQAALDSDRPAILQGELAKAQARVTSALQSGDAAAAQRALGDVASLRKEMGGINASAQPPQGGPGVALQTPADAKVAEERGAAAINAAKVAASTKPLLAAIDQALAINQKVPYGAFGTAELQRNMSNMPLNPFANGDAAKYAGQWDQLMGQNIMNGIASSGLGRMDIPIVNAIKAANGIPMENHPAAREQMLRTLRTLVENHALSAGNIVPALNEPGSTTNTTTAPMQSAANASTAKTPAPPVPMKGMLRGGYKFLGGDPASPNSWEKQ